MPHVCVAVRMSHCCLFLTLLNTSGTWHEACWCLLWGLRFLGFWGSPSQITFVSVVFLICRLRGGSFSTRRCPLRPWVALPPGCGRLRGSTVAGTRTFPLRLGTGINGVRVARGACKMDIAMYAFIAWLHLGAGGTALSGAPPQLLWARIRSFRVVPTGAILLFSRTIEEPAYPRCCGIL